MAPVPDEPFTCSTSRYPSTSNKSDPLNQQSSQRKPQVLFVKYKMQSRASMPEDLVQPKQNAYACFLRAMRDRAMEDMGSLAQEFWDAPGAVPAEHQLRFQLGGMCRRFVQANKERNQLRKLMLQQGVESELGFSVMDAFDNEDREELEGIRQLLKTRVPEIPGGPSQALQKLTFDQALLCMTLLADVGEPTQGRCDSLLLQKDPTTVTGTVTEFAFPKEKWAVDSVSMNRTDFDAEALPDFSSLAAFSDFCQSSETDTPIETITNFLNKRYS